VRSICITAALALALVVTACGGDDKPSGQSTSVRCTPAPGTATTLSIAPKWSKGDTRAIKITKSREESGSEPADSSATADLRVLETGAAGSRLQWKSTDLVLPDDQLPADAKNRLKDVAKGFTVVYATGGDGAYEAKKNVGQIRAQLTKVLDLLEEDPEEAESVSRTRSIILSDGFIQTSVVKEIPVLHSAYGLDLQEGKPMKVEQRIPNPFGGSALTAKGTAELVQARDENGCAIVELDLKPDRAALAKSIADTFGGKAKDVPASTRRAGLSVHTTSRYTYDPGSGWPTRIDVTQTVNISGKSRSDITVITTRP
jgi:hypothetical protein